MEENSQGGHTLTDFEDPYAVKSKTRERKEKLVEYLGEMLQPQTEGFDHVNMDMSFTYLGYFDLKYVNDISISITMAQVYKLKQAEYMLRSMLATFLNSHRSLDAKSMNLFTTMMTKSTQTFEDKTSKKQGFSWFNFGGKKTG